MMRRTNPGRPRSAAMISSLVSSLGKIPRSDRFRGPLLVNIVLAMPTENPASSKNTLLGHQNPRQPLLQRTAQELSVATRLKHIVLCALFVCSDGIQRSEAPSTKKSIFGLVIRRGGTVSKQ